MSKSRSPAEEAAETAQRKIHECIDKAQSFLLEAGAGAGKTYSLIEALKYLIAKRGSTLMSNHQRIACVTYTNVATNEIRSRIDGHSAVNCSTIHAFCWSLLRNFQPFLRPLIHGLHENWLEKLDKVGGHIGQRKVAYDDLGYRKVDDDSVSLHHDDVLALFRRCLANSKFRAVLVARYPILFIDEYQDTDKETIDSIKQHLMSGSGQPLIGFFGDDWQQIYEDTCGRVDHLGLVRINKESNFRSSVSIVKFLNAIRPNLQQQVVDPGNKGSVNIFHTNGWIGERLSGNHWADDLPPNEANRALSMALEQLRSAGWDIASPDMKILMLTHKRIADQHNYRDVVNCFKFNDAFIKKQDPYIKFFADTVEPASAAFREKRYGELMMLLGGKAPRIRHHADKVQLAQEMEAIATCRDGTIGGMIERLQTAKYLRLPDDVLVKEKQFADAEAAGDSETLLELSNLIALKALAYSQIAALTEFINDRTPFSTKHGVKGVEFDDVLVVCGRGWNVYNFGQLIEWLGDKNGAPKTKLAAFERSRNLFYVACSRPKKRLAILFTQKLSNSALGTLNRLCGGKGISQLPL